MDARMRIIRTIGISLCTILALVFSSPAYAAISPGSGDYTVNNDAVELEEAPLENSGEMVFYEDYLIYVAYDRDIRAYNFTTQETQVVCSSAILDLVNWPHALTVSKEGYLYFIVGTQTLYRVNLKSTWPAIFVRLYINCLGTLDTVSQNPWTGAIWCASSYKSGADDSTFLYKVQPDYKSSTNEMKFVRPHGGDAGPMIWQGPRALLYAENVQGSKNGGPKAYFHLLDPMYPGTSETDRVIKPDYLSMDGEVSAVSRGWDNCVYVATGSGAEIYGLHLDEKTLVATGDQPIDGLAFDGEMLFASEIETAASRKAEGDVIYASIERQPVEPALKMADGYESHLFGETTYVPLDNSMTVYDRNLYYPGTNGTIQMLDLDCAVTETMAITYTDGFSPSPTGMITTLNHRLYFLDADEDPKTTIYECDLTANEKKAKVITDCQGSLAYLAPDPVTAEVYYAFSETGGDKLSLGKLVYYGAIVTPTVVAEFNKPHGGENGPIIFSNSNTILYGENTASKGYLHQVDVDSGIVVSDSVIVDSPIQALSYGQYQALYMADGTGQTLYEIKNMKPVTVAVATTGEMAGICYDGYSLYAARNISGKGMGAVTLDHVWKPNVSGVQAEHEASEANSNELADMTVNALNGKGTLGVQESSGVSLDFLTPYGDDLGDETSKRPIFPLGLVGFGLSLNSGVVTGTVTVHFSTALPERTAWWKYEESRGWYQYPEATLSGDGRSMQVSIVDGGEGDADNFRNGYILDPGGPAYWSQTSGRKYYPDFTSDCFVDGCRDSEGGQGHRKAITALALTMMLMGLGVTLRRIFISEKR